jgi:ureidoacrylate peracid hydrolase
MGLTPAQRVDPSHAMVLVVDMQNDFCHCEGAAGRRGRGMDFVQAMIPNLLHLIDKARERGCPVGFVRTVSSSWTDSDVWTEFKNPDLLACAQGSWGAEFYAGFEPLPGELVITKHRYSAFILRAKGIRSLIVTGVGTGMCVFHTLTVGFMLDYYITLVEDCAATTYGPQAHQEAVALVNKHYGLVVPSSHIIDIWSDKLRKSA